MQASYTIYPYRTSMGHRAWSIARSTFGALEVGGRVGQLAVVSCPSRVVRRPATVVHWGEIPMRARHSCVRRGPDSSTSGWCGLLFTRTLAVTLDPEQAPPVEVLPGLIGELPVCGCPEGAPSVSSWQAVPCLAGGEGSVVICRRRGNTRVGLGFAFGMILGRIITGADGEHPAVNRRVAGSNPTSAATWK